MLQSARSVCVVKIVARQSPVVIIARVSAHSRHAIPRKSSQNARQSHVPVERRGEALLQKLPLGTLLHELGRLGGFVHLFVCDTHGKHATSSSVAKPSLRGARAVPRASLPPLAPRARHPSRGMRARLQNTRMRAHAPFFVGAIVVVVRRKRPSRTRAMRLETPRASRDATNVKHTPIDRSIFQHPSHRLRRVSYAHIAPHHGVRDKTTHRCFTRPVWMRPTPTRLVAFAATVRLI